MTPLRIISARSFHLNPTKNQPQAPIQLQIKSIYWNSVRPLALTVMPTSVIRLAVHFTYQVISYLGVTEFIFVTSSYDALLASLNLTLRDPFRDVLFQFLQAFYFSS